MPVSPRDFELYSRMTGAPMPSDAMSRMQMAPEVFEFTKNFARKPNLLEKTGNLIKNIGKIGAYGLGMGMQQSLKAEERLLEEELRNEQAKRDAEIAEVPESPEQVSAGSGVVQTDLNPAQVETYSVPKTTADAYGQDNVPNQTASNIINQKVVQGSQIGDETPNVAQVLSESQDSRPSGFADSAQVERQMRSGMEGSELGKDQLAKFLSQKGLDQALLGAVGERISAEPRIGDASPLLDHPDIVGGEDDINLPSVMNTGSTTNLEDHYREMRRIDAMERNKQAINEIVEKTPTPSEMQVGKSPNVLAGKDQSTFEAIQAGIPQEERDAARMRLKEKTAAKRKEIEKTKGPSIVFMNAGSGESKEVPISDVNSVEDVKNMTREVMSPSVAQKSDDFIAKFVEGARSDIVRGERGNQSLGITRIPATNGDSQVGFVLANRPIDQSPTTATTYGFGVAPGAEDIIKGSLDASTFDTYMDRGLSEARQGKKRKAGEIFEFLSPKARIVQGKAALGDIVM